MFDFGAWCKRVRRLRVALLEHYSGSEPCARTHFFVALAGEVLHKYMPAQEADALLEKIGYPVASLLSASKDPVIQFSEPEIAAVVELPTLVGWSYQVWNELSRDASTWGVSYKGELQAEKLSIAVATQIFTEEYIADFLATRCSQLLSERAGSYTVMDPACGTGHILARVVRRLTGEMTGGGQRPSIVGIVGRLNGCDIDADAVTVCRVVVLLEALRVDPSTAVSVVEILVQRICVLETVEGVLATHRVHPSLQRAYDCVITNPPYLGRRKLTSQMRDFLDSAYPDSALDLCAAVTRRCAELLTANGVLGLVTSDRWMRLKGYHPFRQWFYAALSVDVIVELGDRAFRPQLDLHDGVRVVLTVGRHGHVPNGHTVQYVTATSQRDSIAKAEFLQQCGRRGSDSGVLVLQESLRDDQDGAVFLQGAGAPEGLQQASSRLSRYAQVVVGLQTNDDETFVRYHWQVVPDPTRWFPHNKGGGYVRWFGLNRWVLDQRPESVAAYEGGRSGGLAIYEWFAKSGWTYSWFANGCLGVRRKEAGWSFGRAASTGLFCDDVRLIAFCNSRLASLCVRLIGGKIQLPEGVVRRIPVPNNLSPIDPLLVDAAVAIKQQLVSGDPTDITFNPAGRPAVIERLALEVLLLLIEGELEKQVMHAVELSESERKKVATVIAEPVALSFGGASDNSWEVFQRSLPFEWRALSMRLRGSGGEGERTCVVGDAGKALIAQMLRGRPIEKSGADALPAGGPMERICRSVRVHPVEALACVVDCVNVEMDGRTSLHAEEQKLSLLVSVLHYLGFRWHREGAGPQNCRAASAEELRNELLGVVDCERAAALLGCSVLEWIRYGLEPWHRTLLFNAPILQRSAHDERFSLL